MPKCIPSRPIRFIEPSKIRKDKFLEYQNKLSEKALEFNKYNLKHINDNDYELLSKKLDALVADKKQDLRNLIQDECEELCKFQEKILKHHLNMAAKPTFWHVRNHFKQIIRLLLLKVIHNTENLTRSVLYGTWLNKE